MWATITAGLGLLVGFVVWQSIQRGEPLIPLTLFRHRDFALANAGIALTSFAVIAAVVPLMFYLQEIRGLSATQAALTTTTMAVATGVLAPIVGRLVDRVHPRTVVGPGFTMLTIALVWLSIEMTTETPVWRLMLPLTLMGAAGRSHGNRWRSSHLGHCRMTLPVRVQPSTTAFANSVPYSVAQASPH